MTGGRPRAAREQGKQATERGSGDGIVPGGGLKMI
jgi:hypothetical protein